MEPIGIGVPWVGGFGPLPQITSTRARRPGLRPYHQTGRTLAPPAPSSWADTRTLTLIR